MAKFSTLSSGVSRRTSSHLTSSSSAITCARPVPMCWPISAFTMCIVTLPSGVSVNQIDGVKPVIAGPASAAPLPSHVGRVMLMNAPAAVTAERTRNSRRVVPGAVDSSMAPSILHDLGGALHRADDAGVGRAATQVAGHAVDDLLLARGRIDRQHGGRLH